MMNYLAAHATTTAHHMGILALASPHEAAANPLGGISPSLSNFGAAFTGKFGKITAGVWGAVIAGTTLYLLVGMLTYGRAKRVGHSDDLGEGSEKMTRAGIALGMEVAASLIVGAIIFVAG